MSAARDTPLMPLAVRKRGLLNRLSESSQKIAQMERHLAAERRRRDLLLLKGTTAGFSTRELGAVASISSPAVTYATRRASKRIEEQRQASPVVTNWGVE